MTNSSSKTLYQSGVKKTPTIKTSSALEAPGLKRTATMKASGSKMIAAPSQKSLKKPTTETKTIPTKRYGVASGLSKSYAKTKPANASEKKPEPPKQTESGKKESLFHGRRSTITTSPS